MNGSGLIDTAVEVGVFRGEFAVELLEHWTGRRLILVDTWRHRPDYLDSWNLSNAEMEENLALTLTGTARFGDRVTILRESSVSAAATFADGVLDFIYIDANHSFNSVCQDLAAWYPKVKVGGLISGHDYFDALADDELEPIRGAEAAIPPELLTSYGVKSAVDRFCALLGVTPKIIAEQEPTWYFFKPD